MIAAIAIAVAMFAMPRIERDYTCALRCYGERIDLVGRGMPFAYVTHDVARGDPDHVTATRIDWVAFTIDVAVCAIMLCLIALTVSIGSATTLLPRRRANL